MKLARLVPLAEKAVAAAQKRLPPEVRAAADPVPVCFEAAPGPELLADGLESDLLGLFVGPARDEAGGADVPPQILLFLENLWDYAEGDTGVFQDEVRLTYLHELGHYLGWDEDEIARRGLD